MKHDAKYPMNTTNQETEHAIEAWIEQVTRLGQIERPYIWPGAWPHRDLLHMAQSLPGWHHDSGWIYYQVWDPEIHQAVREFNHSQQAYWAQALPCSGVYQPPCSLIAVLDRDRHAQVALAMWLTLGDDQ
jgi:hypothetical protein